MNTHLRFVLLSLGVLSVEAVNVIGCGSSSSSSSGPTDGGSSSSSQAISDSSPSARADAADGEETDAPADGGEGSTSDSGVTTTLACPLPCFAPSVCCLGFNDDGGGVACIDENTCNAELGGSSYACTGQANCVSGDVCCLTFGGPDGGGGNTAECEDANTCAAGFDTTTAQVCQTTSECPSGTTCSADAGAELSICN